MVCPKRDELNKRALEVLRHLNRLTVEQMDCLKANDQRRLLALDKELEKQFGEKERAFGALQEHSKEHGCW